MAATIKGYIISYRGWDHKTQLEMGMSSFGHTAGEAWRRHVHMPNKDPLDFSTYVQRWSDKGYGPVEVEVTRLGD